ncbi:MAG TPA: YidC/Oxa1 family membrane protein insertase [Candidatus Scatomorpha merdipullorum]|uniref:YidC/Oxa1 family membrane protein insertase n=1 Tax=Candidatus Scatomorpha merdipullorum TaxID=2840927 RepID=A0A9D1FCA8_9FIRM|nr:YidC/Oxa1 family membrane protein insertase [Candidatus Scatomorpha merdipullorum]
MLDAIATPFGWLMMVLYNLTDNFGWAIILFGIIVALVLLPFMAKSKKSMMRMSRLQPRMMELQKKHEGNPQKLNEEMSRLYRENKVSPLGGCLWSLLPLFIMLALYRAVVKPLTIMMGVPDEMLAPGGAIYDQLQALGYQLSNYTTSTNSFYEQIYQAKFIAENFAQFAALSDKLVPMNFNFIGLDLSMTPQWKFWAFDFSNGTAQTIGLFVLPLISTAMSYFSMFLNRKLQPPVGTTQQQQANASSMKTMMYVMPLMSLWIGFVMPAALCVYWIINSLTGILRETGLTLVFKKQMAKEDEEFNAKERAREEELERKRQETERLRALNATTVNKNTSKKKQQAQAAQAGAERRAAAERAERAARRERLGIAEEEKPASQVGNRRFARGRAYVEERFEHPETAAEATAAAAEASEGVDSIDPDYIDETEIIGVPDTAEDAPETADGEQQENVK